jgi:hypothetical protein
MRKRVLTLFALVLSLGSAGCAGSPAPLPPEEQVVKVRLTVRRFPPDANRKAPCDVTLTRSADIAEVTDWLKGIDWSQEGTDLAVVRVPEQDGGIVLTTKEGASSEFSFYWDGKFIHTRANRLLRVGHVDKLQQIVQRACK